MRSPFFAVLALPALRAMSACQTSGGATASTPMRTAGAVLPPKGFVDFCKRFPAGCSEPEPSGGPVDLDAPPRAPLDAVHSDVKRKLHFVAANPPLDHSENQKP